MTFLLYICRKFRRTKKNDKASMAKFLILGNGFKFRSGSLGDKRYARRLVGHPEGIAVECKKPSYTKAQRKKMAERPQVKRFVEVNKEAQVILHDPELRAQWEAKHKKAVRDGSRHNRYVYVRLWDFIRHELNEEKKKGEKAVQN